MFPYPIEPQKCAIICDFLNDITMISARAYRLMVALYPENFSERGVVFDISMMFHCL